MASTGWTGEPRKPGERRQKVFGYLKAANELRQSYAQSFSERWKEGDYQEGMPGGFVEADYARTGDEEMLLFPSYARKHKKATHTSQEGYRAMPGAREDLSNPDVGDADYWKNEWHKYEDQNAIVDVDVRGWIFTPQRGPLNRRNRLVLAVARRLSGIPAPSTSPSGSRETSSGPSWRERAHDDVLSQEEEAAAREANLIEKRGRKEAEAASQGKYATDGNSLIDFGSPTNSRASSPSRPTASRRDTSSTSDTGDSANLDPSLKRASWNLSQQMSKEELLTANEQLVARLRPFMTMPLANTPITIFFFNDKKSQSKSVYTDDSGHFKMRAALDFVPDKVRVLASEKLSATEDVMVTDSRGISVVSDIDDTIKHSAIALGAKEIFKNTFIRELGELTIPGVKEWYSKMASMGVKLHYVSNSPWQLYPLLRSYFAMAGLPPGSFHLKQYAGMLQGIFEPAAERKKGSLDRIMHDFPERKFVLVGDSGEADLEVYTDIVQEHPGRVLAVFIRDVTSKDENNLKDFFYGTHPSEPRRRDRLHRRTPSSQSLKSMKQPESAPHLPDRPKAATPKTEDLIDLNDDSKTPTEPRTSYFQDMEGLQPNGKSPPAKPVKPSNLRSMTTMSPPPVHEKPSTERARQRSDGEIKKAPPPPAPRRTNTGLTTISTRSSNGSSKPPVPPPLQSRDSRTLWQESSHYASPTTPRGTSSPRSASPNPGYLASARQQLSQAYNSLPPIRSQSPSDRRGLTSYPAAAARYVTGASGGDPAAGGDGGAPGQPYDKKMEMWRRRWARSQEVMGKHGVVLRAWRNGTDVMDECLSILENEFVRMSNEDDSDDNG